MDRIVCWSDLFVGQLRSLVKLRNDKNSSQKIRNHEWTSSHVTTLRISRHMAKSDMYFRSLMILWC
ncbi:hypothetical protein T4C_1594 [Trichinella pseudospiralis]|uniref:Uncharacterized protein n=1 Tax=Trichinella pseudospiralis TaxID=6337 RepID=A0A0V1JJ92_TRIPS|nr:hypothetical protein T4C_1594 [Trichinella pseudospiralis]